MRGVLKQPVEWIEKLVREQIEELARQSPSIDTLLALESVSE